MEKKIAGASPFFNRGRRPHGWNKAALRLFPCFVFSVYLLIPLPGWSDTEVRSNMEIYAAAYRGRSDWYFAGTGLADLRFASSGNANIRAEAALEFQPVDLSGGDSSVSISAVSLKRLWFKANFPSWRLTAGKTKVAWGNGFIFNSGDILFGSTSPNVDFTRSSVRDDTAFLLAANIPLGDFSYLEAVILPPGLLYDSSAYEAGLQTISHTSGGVRAFTRIAGWRLEGGYLYKGDAKVLSDLLGHRVYFSFHGHAGADLYGAASLAAGYDADAGFSRDGWNEVRKTLALSLGAFHQTAVGYDSTLSFRFEALLLPWGTWRAADYQDYLDGEAGSYGILLYPEITMNIRSAWSLGLMSVISPVDASAQITALFSWDVFQGFTLIGAVVANAGGKESLFARERSGDWPYYAGRPSDDPEYLWADSEFNGIAFTAGARYSY